MRPVKVRLPKVPIREKLGKDAAGCARLRTFCGVECLFAVTEDPANRCLLLRFLVSGVVMTVEITKRRSFEKKGRT